MKNKEDDVTDKANSLNKEQAAVYPLRQSKGKGRETNVEKIKAAHSTKGKTQTQGKSDESQFLKLMRTNPTRVSDAQRRIGDRNVIGRKVCLRDQLKDKHKRIDDVQRQLKNKEEEFAILEKDLGELKAQVSDLQGQLQEKCAQEKILEEQLRAEQQQVTELQSQLETRKQEEKTKEQQLFNLQAEIEEKDADFATLQARLRHEQRQVTELQTQLTANQQEMREQLREKETDISGLQEQLSEEQQHVSGLQRQLRTNEQEIRTMEQQTTDLRGQVERLRREQQRVTQLQSQLRTNEQENRTLRQQICDLQQQGERVRREQQRVAELQNQLRSIELENSTLRQQLRGIEQRENDRPSRDWVIKRTEIQMTDEQLGQGAWGVVVRGKFRGSDVAVKEMYEDIYSSYNKHLFEREVDIASKCRHPCLLQFIGATSDERPLLVTEIMDCSLRTRLYNSREPPLSEAEVFVISLDVARALNYLHQKKPTPMIHRDVSSANVLLWRQENRWRGKVSDYGTANFVRQSTRNYPGAVNYCAPEFLNESFDQPVSCKVSIINSTE